MESHISASLKPDAKKLMCDWHPILMFYQSQVHP